MTRSGYVLKLTEADHTCATCSAPIRLPKIGEKWWNISTGQLYEIRSTPSEHEPWWGAHRVDAPETGYGCDPGVKAAVWLRAVREGHWHLAPAHAGVAPDLDQAREQLTAKGRLRLQGERNRLDSEAGWTPAHVVVAPDPEVREQPGGTVSPGTGDIRQCEAVAPNDKTMRCVCESLCKERVELHAIIVTRDAEIARLRAVSVADAAATIKAVDYAENAHERIEAAVMEETDRCAHIAVMYAKGWTNSSERFHASNQIANAIRINPGDPAVRQDYRPDVSLDDGRIPITGFASDGVIEPEILRLQREVAAMRATISSLMTTVAKFVKGSRYGRRQDEGDGGKRVPGVHGNDGTDLCEQPAEHAEESADDVGAIVSRPSESSGLLVGSGEGDAK